MSHSAAAPYSGDHPVSTIQDYREEVDKRKQQVENQKDARIAEGKPEEKQPQGDSSKEQEDREATETEDRHDFRSENRNTAASLANAGNQEAEYPGASSHQQQAKDVNDGKPIDTSEDPLAGAGGAKEKRKAIKSKNSSGSRQVTDPVTHLPVTIRDFNSKDLKSVPENLRASSETPQDDSKLQEQAETAQLGAQEMQRLFPPPPLDSLKVSIEKKYTTALVFGLTAVFVVFSITVIFVLLVSQREEYSHSFIASLGGAIAVLTSLGIISATRFWIGRKIDSVWNDEVWAASKSQELQRQHTSHVPESTMWLNSVLSSIWPLINPDLFTSIADQIEDVMQASLPKMVRMIAVKDLGQGNQSVRILGIRCLPSGAAAKSVSEEGKVQDSPKQQSNGDQSHDGQRPGDEKENEGTNSNAQGLEAESGDFVNMELSFSYRAASSGKSLRKKAESAHLFLVFYLPGSLPIPVWASLNGLVGTLRFRFQTSPDPPFIDLCTLTFLGQPQVDISCTPLVKRGLNIMDLPLISSFVNSSISAAMAQYVAPKSLTLNLKQMLTGDDFKKDTNAHGIIFVKIKCSKEMKEGDVSIPLFKGGSNDCYVSCSWAKFAKPLWTTRVISDDLEPCFDEHCMILVGPEELNAHERLRIQLWDSDRFSADDDLGRVEVDLKELMGKPLKGQISEREDSFIGMDGKSSMPGKLTWEVGYFDKVRVTDDQLSKQTLDKDVKNVTELKEKATEENKRKLREATDRDISEEARQELAEDSAELETDLIAAAPPPDGFPSGILSIQIHNATGLEVAKLRKGSKENTSAEDEDEDDLPSPYCGVIINGRKAYQTRTKPKNAKPFFNASTEKFIPDWRDAEIIVSLRDSRVHENDPLLGLVYLPLEKVFKDRSQINETFPLSGGVGYGRLRISLVFRAVSIRLPKPLLGWEDGTLEIDHPINSEGLPTSINAVKIRLSTPIGSNKMRPENGKWILKKDRTIRLAVRNRYATPLAIKFYKKEVLGHKTMAFAILWLREIPDDEEVSKTLSVWEGDDSAFKRASKNHLDSPGKKIGSIQIKLKLFAGLSDYHRKLKDNNVNEVIECLDTASDNKETRKAMSDTADDDDDSSSSSSDESTKSIDVDGKRGPIDQVKDYKDHRKVLHRQQRGLMQWKAARTGAWLRSKVKDGVEDKLMGAFRHHDSTSPNIETEV